MMIIGHSHTACIAEAAGAAGAGATWIDLWLWPNVTVPGENGRRLGDELREALTGLVVSSVGGGTHHVMGLHAHPHPFDFVVPGHPDLPMIDGATIVPHDQVRETMKTAGAEDFEILRLLGESAPGRMIHIPPPPTLRNERPIDHPLWRKVAGDSDVVSPPWFRRKLELVHTSVLREICEATGIVLAPPPAEAVDEDGFLRPEFAGNPCHGNIRYGALVLEQARALAA